MDEDDDPIEPDEDQAYDLLREDGWTHDDILHRRTHLAGEYLGAQGERREGA